ncbi:unnamed protein product [Auanema sp. JU1783]|nr:unnamed protein product [Auanema sp. JU1783]
MSPSITPSTLNSNTPWEPSQINNIISNPPLTTGLTPLQQAHPAISLGLRTPYHVEPSSSTFSTAYQLVHPTYLPNNFQPVPKLCGNAQLVNQSIQTSQTAINTYLNQPISNQSSFNSRPFMPQSDHLLLNQLQLTNQLPLFLASSTPFSGLNLLPSQPLENICNESNQLNDFIQRNYVSTLTHPTFPNISFTDSSSIPQREPEQSEPSSLPVRQVPDSTESGETSASTTHNGNEKIKTTVIKQTSAVPNLVTQAASSSDFEEGSKSKTKPREDDFVMGEISTENYYPTHFLRGSMIRLANGSLRKVEDLSTDDFLSAAAKTNEFLIESAHFIKSTRVNNNVQITFHVTSSNSEKTIEVQLEYPLFVVGKGWCSVEPERTLETYGLDARLLKPGDVCITMVQKKEDLPPIAAVVTISKAHEINQRKKRLARWRDELENSMGEVYLECMRHRRASAPPRLEKICCSPPQPSFEMYEI